VALLPVTYTDSYTLYYTSAAPISTGLEAHTVVSPGVQTLVVSSTNPLVLFNLEVSLQWDARNDDLYMAQLAYDLQRTSELLYDWTDGQAALGEVRVYHQRERWNDAHVRVYATNRLRPNAMQGGVVSEMISDTDVVSVTYGPGQVNMGAVWNRYGESGGGIGEDWPRTLAHELGHYLLFLDDNYIGLDENGLIISVEGCTGAMGDPYREDYPYDEFHVDDVAWQETCTRTLSHQTTGRADWATMGVFYPWLNVPTAETNAGPSNLGLAVTGIEFIEPITPTEALEDPTFYLSQGGSRVQPGSSARAFLYQDGWLVDLGRPVLDHVLARGAGLGDRVCVYELEAARLGCEAVSENDEQLEMATAPEWQPSVIVTPVTSRTIEVAVTNVMTGAGWEVEGRVYPLTDPAPGAISLTETSEGYSGTFTLEEPALSGFVQVRVISPTAPLREIVTDYALGGNPGHMRGARAGMRGRMGHMRGARAPAVSADGQVILFGEKLEELGEGEFFTLQAATVIPWVPRWARVVGQGYRLVASSPTLELGEASLSFQYMGNEVPAGEETWLRVYYLAPLSETWQLLPTMLDVYHNAASAPARGEGLYVLMSSLEIELEAGGWNLISYPVEGTRAVTEALLSISGYYTTVYGYEETDEVDPWKVYDVGVPEWVNDLYELEFGQGYWINVSEPLTLYLKGRDEVGGAANGGFPYPPATYYGRVLTGTEFVPTAGMSVTARVGGKVCGQGVLTEVAGYGVGYAVNVMAEDWGAYGGCGAPGREVVFWVGDEEMAPRALWDNRELEEVELRPLWRVRLPMVMHGYVSAPDLVVEALIVAPDAITVVIKNEGPAPTIDAFWVDVYVNPSPAPSGVNQTWPMLASEGLVWGITGTLQPSEAITLTIGGEYYWEEHSAFTGGLVPGTWVYAQADSVGEGTAYGAVLETHEITGDPYNNIVGVQSP
jgi:hypothetical protein